MDTRYFVEICVENVKSEIPLEDFKRDDSLFCNEAVRKAFTKFQKYDPCSKDESSVLALVRFEAVITDSVDAFQVLTTSYLARSHLSFSPDYGERRQETLSSHWKVKKGGTI